MKDRRKFLIIGAGAGIASHMAHKLHAQGIDGTKFITPEEAKEITEPKSAKGIMERIRDGEQEAEKCDEPYKWVSRRERRAQARKKF